MAIKKGIKIGLWIISIVILALVIIIGPEYKFVKTYPAACWSDDGKQIVYLEHRELRKTNKLTMWGDADDILKSKTYLCIMDANGKNKRVVEVVPEWRDKETYNERIDYLLKNEYGKNIVKSSQQELNWHPTEPKFIYVNKYIYECSNIINIQEVKKKGFKEGFVYYIKKGEIKVYKLPLHEKTQKSYLFIPFWWRV